MCGDEKKPCKHKAGEPHFSRAGKFRTLELKGIEPIWRNPDNSIVAYDLDRKIIWLAIKGLPKLRLRIDKQAPPPKEDLKSIKISIQGRRVYAHLGYAVDIPAAPRTGVDAGIDLGVTDTLATSEGRRIGANKAVITDGELIKRLTKAIQTATAHSRIVTPIVRRTTGAYARSIRRTLSISVSASGCNGSYSAKRIKRWPPNHRARGM